MRIKLFNTYIIISPYLLLIILLCTITNRIYEFLICCYALIIHESGHIITAYILHEKISIFKILPLGFSCTLKNQTQITSKHMIKILVAGPAVSLITAGLFFLWTEDFAIINLMIGLFNLIPVGELDGMRIVNIFLEKRIYK